MPKAVIKFTNKEGKILYAARASSGYFDYSKQKAIKYDLEAAKLQREQFDKSLKKTNYSTFVKVEVEVI